MRKYNSLIIRLHLLDMLHQGNHFCASCKTFTVQTDIKSIFSWKMKKILFCHSFSTCSTSAWFLDLSNCTGFTKDMKATCYYRLLNIIHTNKAIFEFIFVYFVNSLFQKCFRNFIVLLWDLHTNFLLTLNHRLEIILGLLIFIYLSCLSFFDEFTKLGLKWLWIFDKFCYWFEQNRMAAYLSQFH